MTKKWRCFTGILATNLLVIIILSVSAVWARPTTAAQAKLVVENWLALGRPPLGETLGQQVREVRTFPDASNPLYYVVYLNPGGLVIMPGDDLVEPIVGFLRTGLYDPSESNPLGALVSRDLPGRVLQARKVEAQGLEYLAPETPQAVAQRKWAWLAQPTAGKEAVEFGLPNISDVRVEPFVKSKWAQDMVNDQIYYNYYTPYHYRAGCIATAMAQLMRYYQYPTKGVGPRKMTLRVDWREEPAYLKGGDSAGGPYDWGNMVLDPQTSGVIEIQRQAIAALTFDAGVSVNMNYRSDGVSTSDSYKAAGAFVDVFQYSQAKYGYNNDTYNIPVANLYAMANPNLDKQYPVQLGLGGSGAIGHAVLTDGYGYDAGTMYHHLNLGWADGQSVWYNLPNVDSSPSYNTVHTCIYNVFKDGTGEIISGRVTTAGKTPISGATVTASRTGGGTYTATTNAKGIYALAQVPSASTCRVTVVKAGYAFRPQTVATGTSTDNTIISGNLWGVDFTGTSPRKPLSGVYLLLWD